MVTTELLTRTKRFTIDLIIYCKSLPKSDEVKIVKNQLIRSASSVGANYRAACRARSKAEFLAKINIVLEEADESLFCCEILDEANLDKSSNLSRLTRESLELVKIFSSTRKTARNK